MKSKLWQDLSGTFSTDEDSDLSTFRQPGSINSRLASWDPMDPTARHFKFNMWNVIDAMPLDFFQIYKGFGRSDFGNPMSIRRDGVNVNIDYALSADEVLFLKSSGIDFAEIVEIGAGFGRTCHALLCSFPVERYVIVDLPEMLSLSSTYLRKVLTPEMYEKISFVDALANRDFPNFSQQSDLVINIDSFQEMTRDVIEFYEQQLISKARYFYSKQAIGKYDPAEFGINVEVQREDVFDYGLSTEKFTICDDVSYTSRVKGHIEEYSFGKSYKVVSDRRCPFFHFYHHIIYRNTNDASGVK